MGGGGFCLLLDEGSVTFGGNLGFCIRPYFLAFFMDLHDAEEPIYWVSDTNVIFNTLKGVYMASWTVKPL